MPYLSASVCGGVSLQRGSISSVCTFTFTGERAGAASSPAAAGN